MFKQITGGLMSGVLATCLWCAPADGAGTPAGEAVLAEVNGVKLTLGDLEKKSAAALFQARTAYYDTERKVIEGFIDEYLLEQQARKEGVTVAELLERHVNAAAEKDPSEEALRVYYEGVETAEPYDAVRGKIVEAVRARRTAKARAAYLQSLRRQSTIILRLAPPRAPVSMKDVPVRGPANAAVTLLEFADYECPYCQQIHPVLNRLEAEFKGKLAFAYKDYPLPMHPEAQKAAEAAHCASAQGKFWDYHDLLFEKKQLAPAALKAYARDLKLDGAAFDTCLDTSQSATVVGEHAKEAQALGLQGTPTILINGRSVTGNLSYERLHAGILEELSAAGAGAGAPPGSAEREKH